MTRSKVEALREQAKGLVAIKDWEAAEAAYNEAICCLEETDEPVIEVPPSPPPPGDGSAAPPPAAEPLYMVHCKLLSNRSMVRLSRDKFAEALEDAEKSLIIRPTFSKGYYRQGQALSKLGRHADALRAFENGVLLNCKDKSTFKRLADGARELLKSAGAADADVAASESVAPAAAFSEAPLAPGGAVGSGSVSGSGSGSGRMCNGCLRRLEREAYSSSMWKAKGKRRCEECVQANRPVSPVAKDKVGFSFKSEDGLTVTTSSGIKVVMNKETGNWAAPHRSTMTRAQQKEFDEIQCRLRDIAKAAGVDWGDEEQPPRMKEMQRRHNEVLTLSHAGSLSLREIKAYHDWLANMMSGIADEHKDLERRFKLAQAKAKASRDPARAVRFQTVAETLMRNDFVRHNREVDMAKFEMAWLQDSPAWKKVRFPLSFSLKFPSFSSF